MGIDPNFRQHGQALCHLMGAITVTQARKGRKGRAVGGSGAPAHDPDSPKVDPDILAIARRVENNPGTVRHDYQSALAREIIRLCRVREGKNQGGQDDPE